MPVTIDQLPLAASDRDTALLASRRPPAGSLVIVQGTASRMLALALAHSWTDPADVAVLEPPTGRWTAADVRELLAASATRTPQARHALVVTAADTFTQALYDRTLKVFEEPPAPSWFLLCVDDAAQVPTAVRGRAGLVLHARPGDAAVRTGTLVAAGLDQATAARAVAACHGRVELELAVAADPDVLGPLEQVAELRAGGQAPLTRAHEAMATVDTLAAALEQVAGSRAAAHRTVIGLLLDRWAAQAARLLRSDHLPAADAVQLCDRFLGAVDDARDALARNVSPAAVLAVVMAAA